MSQLLLLQIVAVVLTPAVFIVSIEIGFRLGRRTDTGKRIDTGPIQGASLGLLGLLLAFSFAGSAGRFVERQTLVFEEANAIGTAYLRADLIPEPYATEFRDTLRVYTEHRSQAGTLIRDGVLDEFIDEVPRYPERLWAIARDGTRADPTGLVPVINAVNEVIDMHTLRVAANKHVKTPVLVLLVVCSLLTLGVIGYSCGTAGSRNFVMTTVVALLIASTLLTSLDLDLGRVGLIQISDQPLVDLDFSSALPSR